MALEVENIHLTLLISSSIILLFFFFLIRLDKKQQKQKQKLNLPPGPRPLPLIGHLHLLGDLPHISLQRLAAKYGPVLHLSLGQVPTVIVSSTKAAREALCTQDIHLATRPQFFAARHLLYNCTDMAFAPYGAYWRHVRKICTLELLSARRVESFAAAREAEVSRLIGRIAEQHGPIELSRLLGLYANGVLCRSAFGKDFLAGGEYDRYGFHKMLHEYTVLMGGFSIGDFFPSLEWINGVTGMTRRLEWASRRFDQLFDGIIRERLEKRKESRGGQPAAEHKDLLDVLLDLKDEGAMDMPLTMDNIKAIILDMFTGGTDTTFTTLDWGMTELMRNPEAMKRAQAEVRSIMGERKTVVASSDIPKMQYLKAVIKEIFRLHPAAPLLLPRVSTEAVTIDGYDIPTNTRFFVNVWAIGRDPEIWKDPESFLPERFIGSSIDFRGQDFELLPFGAGRRGCPGVAFGVAGVEIALAQLLHSFDWELPPGIRPQDLDTTDVYAITMHRKAKLVLVPKPRFV